MSSPAPARDLKTTADFARELARRAGMFALTWSGPRAPDFKSDDSPVTQADHDTQQLILDDLAKNFANDAIIVEETVPNPDRHADDSRWCWVIDPIDGTRNFSRGSRGYSTAIALLEDGMPVVGAIFDARTQSVYSAWRGGGAYCDDRRLHVTGSSLNSQTVLGVSSFRNVRAPDELYGLLSQVMFRNLGSQCLHMCSVACGDFDAVCTWDAKAWDIAAGSVIISEAGGVVSGPNGAAIWPMDVNRYARNNMPLLAANPQLHAELSRHFRHLS